MSSSGSGQTERRTAGSKGDAARSERLRAALRQNLKRRKVQARGRSEAGPGADTGAAHDSAGIVKSDS